MTTHSRIGAPAALALAIALATAPATAQSIPGMPTLPTLPDICLWSYCISYTQSSLGALMQSVRAQFQNLTSLGNVQQNPLSQLGPLLAPATAANPNVATNAAAATIQQAPMTEAQLQAINANAAASTGAHADAQASNDYLSTIATEQEQSNVTHAQEIQQHASDTQTTLDVEKVLYSGKGW